MNAYPPIRDNSHYSCLNVLASRFEMGLISDLTRSLSRIMKLCGLPLVLITVLLFWSFSAHSAIYELSPDATRHLRLNIPDGTPEIRGILIFGNGAGGDARGNATNAELVAFAQSLGFVVLATGYWSNFSFNDYEINLFEWSLQQLAAMSGFPELVDAPWMPMGHSNGGQMSYGLNTLRPSKVIGFITSKGCCYNNFEPSEAALQTPGLLIAGETDSTTRRNNIKSLFTINRPRGALWAWVEEENAGHEEGATRQIILPFLAECYRLRYPRDQSPVDGPVILKTLNEWDGWLVDQTTWESGFPAIYRYDLVPGDPRTMGWVPNQRMASLYRAFASYNRISSTTGGSSGVFTAPTTLTHSVTLPAGSWNLVEFYEGDKKIGEASPSGGNSPQISLPTSYGGMRAFHTVITKTNGSKVATPIRRVFVKGPVAPLAYDGWAETNLPAGRRGRSEAAFDDGLPNLIRFTFDLPISQRGGQVVDLTTASEEIEGITYNKLAYTMSDQAREAEVQVVPLLSEDLATFTTVRETEGVFLRRSDNTIEILTDQSTPKMFLKLVVDDPLP